MTKEEQYELRNEPRGTLTPRELEVLNELKDGCSAQKAADNLFVEKRTIEGHVKSITYKMHARNITNAVSIAYQTGVLKINIHFV